MKSSELSNGETASLYDNFCKTGNDVINDVISGFAKVVVERCGLHPGREPS